MTMEISGALCTGCGKCVAECPLEAISPASKGKYKIDPTICNECEHIYEKQCVAVCPEGAIGKRDADGILVMQIADPTPRVRPHMLMFLVSLLHGWDHHCFSEQDRRNLAPLLGAAYRDPDFQFRVVMNFDDGCRGCPNKCVPGHAEEMGDLDQKVMDKLGLELGMKIRLWDAVRLVQDKMSLDLLKNDLDLKKDLVDCILSGMPAEAAIWTNP